MSTPMGNPAGPGARPGSGAPALGAARPGDARPGPVDEVPGRVVIAEPALARLAERVVTEVPDARPVGGRTPRHRRAVRATIDGRVARLRVRLGVRWPASVPRVSAAVREHLVSRVSRLTGLSLETVDITVSDLSGDHPDRPRVR